MDKKPRLVRINKRLVELGLVSSRRKADETLLKKEVTVNGKLAGLGDTVQESDDIKLNGQSGIIRNDITILLNKPKGYICSHVQQGHAATIFSILPKEFGSLKIAGRLDKNSQGLVVLSSDGKLTNELSHPDSNKLKTYIVTINKKLEIRDKNQLTKGIELEDGLSVFLKIKIISPEKFRLSLSQGRNRQIRRTLAHLGYKVIKLERISIDRFELGTIPSGKYQFVNTMGKKS